MCAVLADAANMSRAARCASDRSRPWATLRHPFEANCERLRVKHVSKLQLSTVAVSHRVSTVDTPTTKPAIDRHNRPRLDVGATFAQPRAAAGWHFARARAAII